jgi:hypothetical protein
MDLKSSRKRKTFWKFKSFRCMKCKYWHETWQEQQKSNIYIYIYIYIYHVLNYNHTTLYKLKDRQNSLCQADADFVFSKTARTVCVFRNLIVGRSERQRDRELKNDRTLLLILRSGSDFGTSRYRLTRCYDVSVTILLLQIGYIYIHTHTLTKW